MASSGGQGAGGAVRRRPRPPPPDEEEHALYFTYGSNLHIAQMAERCPASRFVGKGKLSGYRWQINERGVANIVETNLRADVVRGLIFEVNTTDVRALDRYEGVRSRAYSRVTLEVQISPNDAYARKKSTEVAARLQAYHDSHPRGTTLAGRGTVPDVKLPTLVYVSKNHIQDGTIRAEYIPRMANAIADAKALGVSRSYIKEFMEPYLGDPNAAAAAAQAPPQAPPQPPVSETQPRPAGVTFVASQPPGRRPPGRVEGVIRHLRLTRPREQRRGGGVPLTLAERPAPGTVERRRDGSNVVVVAPSNRGGRRAPASGARARADREAREREQGRLQVPGNGDVHRWRGAPDHSGGSGDERGSDRSSNGGGESSGTSANANAPAAANRRAVANAENGNAQRAPANGEGSGTTTPANGPGAGPRRSAANAEGSGTTTPANGSGAAAPKRPAARAGNATATTGNATATTGNATATTGNATATTGNATATTGNATATTGNAEGSVTTGTANTNASTTPAKRAAARTEGGGAQKAANGESNNGTAAPANANGAPTPAKRTAAGAGNGGAQKPANGEGNGTAAPANATAAGPKKAGAKAENGGAQKPANGEGNGTAATGNGTGAATKKAANRTDGNGTAAANGAGPAKKAGTKAENTAAQS